MDMRVLNLPSGCSFHKLPKCISAQLLHQLKYYAALFGFSLVHQGFLHPLWFYTLIFQVTLNHSEIYCRWIIKKLTVDVLI